MIITFVSHYVYFYNEIDKKKVLDFLEETIGDTECQFYLGYFGAFDIFAKKCCLEYKATHPNVKLIHIATYHDKIYNARGYDEKFYLPLQNEPTFRAIQYRNEWMVQNADIVITNARYRCGFIKNFFVIAERGNKKVFNIAETEQ